MITYSGKFSVILVQVKSFSLSCLYIYRLKHRLVSRRNFVNNNKSPSANLKNEKSCQILKRLRSCHETGQ